MEINKFYRCKESSRNNYRSRNLIGHYPFWVISPGNSTSFTRPFLAGRRARAGHETRGVCGASGASGASSASSASSACGVCGVSGACGARGVSGACGVSGAYGGCGVSCACGVSGPTR